MLIMCNYETKQGPSTSMENWSQLSLGLHRAPFFDSSIIYKALLNYVDQYHPSSSLSSFFP